VQEYLRACEDNERYSRTPQRALRAEQERIDVAVDRGRKTA
jgi:hypothetical protein